MRPLKTYEDWKHCITEICRIPLTPDFVRQRLNELRNVSEHNTRRFVSSWGEPHRQQVIAWFEQAQRELAK
jgi:hypothetical protein